jgi:serine/threonine protein kinase
MDYATEGNLRANLIRLVETTHWSHRLYLLYKILCGLCNLHALNFIHCDLHDGNILHFNSTKGIDIEDDKDDEVHVIDRACISDLGLCRPVSSIIKKDDICGVMPFMAPEILRGNAYTQASDIYSFSMIMWEFTSGVTPFNDRAHDIQLSLSICKGERPEIIENTPQCYVDLMKKCWDEDPLKRPSALEVKNIIEKWAVLYDAKVEDINEELKNDILEFMSAPIGHRHNTETHSQAYFTSRIHNFTSSELNETLESEGWDNYRINND